jgi:hypothetical protein
MGETFFALPDRQSLFVAFPREEKLTLQEFRNLTSKWQNHSDRKLFGAIVAAARTFISLTELAVHFEVSEGVIEFWSSGNADPSEWRQNAVVRELDSLAIKAAQKLGFSQ